MADKKEETHPQIGAMKNVCLDIGSRVEIILKQGAEWYNGYTPAPTVNPRGYEPPKDKSKLMDFPGLLAIGYVAKMESDRVTLAPTWSITYEDRIKPVFESGGYYVHGDVVLAFRKIDGV